MNKNTFFEKKLPIQKSRQYMAEIDLYMIKRVRLGLISWFVISFVLSAMMFDANRLGVAQMLVVLVLILSLLLRGIYIWQFDYLYGRGADVWRQRFLWSTVFSSLCWGVFAASIIINWQTNGDLISLLTLTFTSVLALGAPSLYKPYEKFLYWYLACILVPIALVLSFQNTGQSWVLFVATIALFAYVREDVKQQFQSFWASRQNQFELQFQLGEQKAINMEVQRRNDVSDRFVKNVMEVVRPQLTTMLGLLPLLNRTSLSADQDHIVKLMSYTTKGLQNATVDLEAYTAIRSGKLLLENKPFNLSRFVEEVMEVAGASAHARGVELSYLHNLDVPERIVGDVAHLQTCLNGLLGYAISISDDGEMSLKVSQFFRDQFMLRFQLRIPYMCNEIPHKLENAQQLKMMEEVELGGFDLGLTVAFKLLLMMDAKIEVRLHKKQYIEVLVLLPLDVSSHQSKSFQPDIKLKELSVALVDLPEKGEKALQGEFDSWGMRVEKIDFEDKQQRLDMVLMNVSVVHDIEQIENRISEVLTYCKLTGAQLALYNSLQYAQIIADAFPDITQIPKPVSRKKLHDGLLAMIIEKETKLSDKNKTSSSL